jgi:hypothetical protein
VVLTPILVDSRRIVAPFSLCPSEANPVITQAHRKPSQWPESGDPPLRQSGACDRIARSRLLERTNYEVSELELSDVVALNLYTDANRALTSPAMVRSPDKLIVDQKPEVVTARYD